MLFLFQNKRCQLLMVTAVAILLNLNTLSHQYALDDETVIKKNMVVQKGFAGIGELLTADAYEPYFHYAGADTLALTGGRYRPLSIVSFAIEQQLFGKTLGQQYQAARDYLQSMERLGNDARQLEAQASYVKSLEKEINDSNMSLAPVRHGFQVFWFALCCGAFYYLACLLFPDRQWLPFAASLLFAMHPVHTEVVANIKSRDEIFSLLYIFLPAFHLYVIFKMAATAGWPQGYSFIFWRSCQKNMHLL